VASTVIATAVDDFIVSPPGFKYHVTEQVGEASGGPQRYTGRSMEDSHRHLLITEDEWQAFIDDFNQTLDKFEVPQQERSELLAIIQSTRDAVVVGPASSPLSSPPHCQRLRRTRRRQRIS
jgi:truncated hemoglobin YjbI